MDKIKGIIVYDKATAKERQWYIDKYINSAALLGASISLVTDDQLNMDNAVLDGISFAIVRVINNELSSFLEGHKVKVYNSAFVSKLCNDKGATYDYIRDNTNVPFMPYISAEDAVSEGVIPSYPMVLKSRGGHGGMEVFFINDQSELLQKVDSDNANSFILQEPCDTLGVDVRVYVINGKIVCAMKRQSEQDFRSNYCLGGKAYPYEVDDTMRSYVEQITKAIRLDFAGIDFIFHRGMPVFNEIEDVVGARMVYANTDIDIVDLYVRHIIEDIRRTQDE